MINKFTSKTLNESISQRQTISYVLRLRIHLRTVVDIPTDFEVDFCVGTILENLVILHSQAIHKL